jgi:hypothetical protein
MKYKYIRKKTYLFYNPKQIISYLFKSQREHKNTMITISKNEYRKFMKYGKIDDNIKRILFYYYSHRIQKDKNVKSKSLFDFYYYSKEIITENKTPTPPKEEINFYQRLLYHLNKQNLKISFKFIPRVAKPFIILNTDNGLYWITLKKKAFKKVVILNNDFVYEEIGKEINHLIKNQLSETKSYNKLYF